MTVSGASSSKTKPRWPGRRGTRARDLAGRHRLLLAVIGATPVSAIGLSAIAPLGLDFRTLTFLLLPPAMTAVAIMLVRHRSVRPFVVEAIAAGAVATLLYDLFRWSFLMVGLMERDPIPDLGSSLGLEPGWFFGYLWRYVGNGGGIALAFIVAGPRGIAAGTVHGLIVCSGLLAVLAFSPFGQEILFPLEPATLVVAVVGHVIYGSVLGFLTSADPAASAASAASVAAPRSPRSRRRSAASNS